VSAKRILLHACCAPCACYPFSLLTINDVKNVSLFYYNPNIYPLDEYNRRLDELRAFSDKTGAPLIIGERDDAAWEESIKDYVHLGERSERCRICYRFRMETSFKYAVEHGFDEVGTVLTVSPHKNSQWIHEIGMQCESKFGLSYLDRDFKKDDGFKKGSLISREYGFYRQTYCGCRYSLEEMKSRKKQTKDIS
jgi:predicted adenine nucleotide alpha hydrolase (AANH) superfamily ATPase